jgi:hypothetical protein
MQYFSVVLGEPYEGRYEEYEEEEEKKSDDDAHVCIAISWPIPPSRSFTNGLVNAKTPRSIY